MTSAPGTVTRIPALGVSPSTSSQAHADAARWDRRLAVVVLIVSTGAFFSALDSSDEAGSPLARGIWMLIYLLAAVRLLDGAVRHRMRVRLPVLLLLYAALALASVTWSAGPDLSLRRSIGFVGTCVVGLWLAQRLRPLELLDALRQAVLVLAVCSLLLYASGSSLAIDDSHGTLQGVLSTKNALGRMMAIGILAAATTALLDGRRARACTRSALPMVIALALTDSTGGTVVAVGVMLCMVGALLWRARAGQVLLLSAIALSLSALVVLLPVASLTTVTGLVGEDATFTGRTEIWTNSIGAISQEPLLGYGYAAFWELSTEAQRIHARIGWPAPSAHNGILDVALELGLVGALLVVAMLVSLFVQGVRDARSGFVAGAFVRLPIVLLIFLSTLVESGLLRQNVLLTVLLVAAMAIPRPDTNNWVDATLNPAPEAPDTQGSARMQVRAGSRSSRSAVPSAP